MEIDQNLLVDNIDYSDVIFNIDEYLPCYDEVSYQTIDNILQTTSPPTDMSMTTTLIKQANTETDITALPSNVSSSESIPICIDLSDTIPQPTVMLSDNTHKLELVNSSSVHNNVQPSTHHLHNTIVETEINQKFASSNSEENNEKHAVTNPCDRIETSQHKNHKVNKACTIKKPKQNKIPKSTKKPKTLNNSVMTKVINTPKKTKYIEIMNMKTFIIEHLSGERFDEYPIKIFTSNKGTIACLKISIKRNITNTNLIPNNQHSVNTLKVKIRSVLTSIIKFAIESNIHNCCTVTHFVNYKTDMHTSININYPWKFTSTSIKNELMKLRSDDLIDRIISACKNNI